MCLSLPSLISSRSVHLFAYLQYQQVLLFLLPYLAVFYLCYEDLNFSTSSLPPYSRSFVIFSQSFTYILFLYFLFQSDNFLLSHPSQPKSFSIIRWWAYFCLSALETRWYFVVPSLIEFHALCSAVFIYSP